VVVTAAAASDHPEVTRARALGIPVVTRKAALAQLVVGRQVVGVAGTHGKTTTTVMTTEALAAAGFEPTALAGGRVSSWGGNARLGGDELYVVEADEYDQAFLALSPSVAVVTTVEPEHLECYDGSPEQLEAAFAEFAGRAETALIGTADEGSERVAGAVRREDRGAGRRVWRYGFSPGSDLAIEIVAREAGGSQARVRLPDGRRLSLGLRVPGRHNVANATAAVGVVVALGGAPEAAADALARFEGVGRRFERVGEAAGIVVVDDYAHHPTEITATLAAARQAYPGRRIVAVFQPHLYSRTALQAEAMGQALTAADRVFVTEVYPAREEPIPGVSGRLVAEAAAARGAVVGFEAERERLRARVRVALRPGDVVLTMGAGDITALGPELIAGLSST
jgi:UDP-N-acetylmuramate--alanine ligase